MTLSILVGLWALWFLLVICFRLDQREPDQPEPVIPLAEYLFICQEEWPGVGVCQRNRGHGGAHTFVTWPKPGTVTKASWTTEP